MANLKEIRNRISSVASTMKMVSAAKLKRAQDAITRMRPYAEKMQEILSGLSSSLDISENVYASDREVKNVLLVVVTSNRGLCGGFNNNVIKESLRLIREEYKDKSVSVVTIGKKATDAYKRTDYRIKGSHLPGNVDDVWNDLTFEHASHISERIMEAYVEKHIDKVILIFNSFKNVATQVVKAEQLLPIMPPEQKEEATNVNLDYIFEPSKEEIVTDLMPKSLKVKFFSALLDSNAGEHGARMTAMHKATDNATELRKALVLDYNKARQAAITNEILEIVGGAEALNG